MLVALFGEGVASFHCGSRRVELCGYSIPHPSENRVNIRIQTTKGAPANKVFRDGCQNLMSICQQVRGTPVSGAVEEFTRKQAMDEDSN
uniref:DNA-directed RNA polymerase RBP11-like dimerisation domain-containing protein n=1 Tax=Kalanchoe fedtschenkoi TaxID=63787 RepID=A0A7N0ZUH9_KALFE